jgi:hypothetical protein
MSAKSDTIEVVARVANEMEASLIVQCLTNQGITARAVGGFTSGFRAEAPGDVSVLVMSGDLERAKKIVAAAQQGLL